MRSKKRQLVTEYRLTFLSEYGKSVLDDLRKKCILFDRSAKEINPKLDKDLMLYLEGQRSVLLYIYKMLTIDPNADMQTRAIGTTEPV